VGIAGALLVGGNFAKAGAEEDGFQGASADSDQEAEAAKADALDKRIGRLEERLSLLEGLELHGMVAADYTYNFNRPDSDKNGPVLFNEDANTVGLNLANIRISHSSLLEGLGFLTDLDFGDSAEIVGAVTRWSNNPDNTESQNSFELRQAYLTYRVPVGSGLDLKGGKFVTLHGAEIIKTWDNFNYNISNSILFGFAIPFTHTGVMATYRMNDFLALDLGLVNGWDNVADNNDGKTFHGGISITPHEKLSFYISGSYGPEQEDRGDSKRSMLATLVTFKPVDRLTFIVDHNWGRETDLCPRHGACLDPALPESALTEPADWHGIAGYAILGLTDKLSFALRGEWFDDVDGVRTGAKQDLWELTPTVSYTISEGLLARFEYRHDESSRRFFERRGNLISGQEVIAGELIYAF